MEPGLRDLEDSKKQILENLQMNRQILLRILAYGDDEIIRVLNHLIAVVVETAVAHQLPDGAFAAVHAIEDGIELRDRIVQLLGEVRVFGQNTDRSFAGIHVLKQLVQVLRRFAQIGVERLVFQKLDEDDFHAGDHSAIPSKRPFWIDNVRVSLAALIEAINNV